MTYDPEQPRDEDGKWTDGGGVATSSRGGLNTLAKLEQAHAVKTLDKHFKTPPALSPEEMDGLSEYENSGNIIMNQALRKVEDGQTLAGHMERMYMVADDQIAKAKEIVQARNDSPRN